MGSRRTCGRQSLRWSGFLGGPGYFVARVAERQEAIPKKPRRESGLLVLSPNGAGQPQPGATPRDKH